MSWSSRTTWITWFGFISASNKLLMLIPMTVNFLHLNFLENKYIDSETLFLFVVIFYTKLTISLTTGLYFVFLLDSGQSDFNSKPWARL